MQTMMTKMKEAAIRSDLVEAAQQAYNSGLCGAFTGNFSIIDREKGRVYITPEGIPWYLLTPEQIVEIEINRGKVLQAAEGVKPSKEAYLHNLIYKEKEGMNAVVHTHSPYATAFAVKGVKIPSITTESLYYGKDMGLAEFYPTGSILLAQEVSKKIGDNSICLMKNHGVLSTGKDLSEAFRNAMFVEANAKTAILSKLI